MDNQASSTDILVIKAKRRFQGLHSEIVGEISTILKKAKLMPIVELQANDPSFTAIVEELRRMRQILEILHDHLGDEISHNMSILDTYIDLADSLAQAIANDSPDCLGEAIAALDEQPYI